MIQSTGVVYRLLLSCLVGLLFIPPVSAQTSADSLDTELIQLSRQAQLPGFSAIIVNNGQIVYQKSVGYADIATQSPFTISTTETIGSVSKTFIAVALMKAIEKGYFTLETDINAILPFKVINPYSPDEPIRIKHLVTHTSGIVDNDSVYNRSYQFKPDPTIHPELLNFMKQRGYVGGLKDTTLSSFMRSYLVKEGRLYSMKNFSNSVPGRRSSYSNIGSALVAYLIEVKAGMSFAAFTQVYLLQPMHMTRSGWFLDDKTLAQQATPYFTKAIRFPFYSLITYPDGGLRSCALDLSLYVSEMMKGLNGQSVLLSKVFYERMFTPSFSAADLPENFSLKTRNKGVFWNLYRVGFIGHDGDDPGVSTNILFNQQTGIIFMTNIYLEDRSGFLNALKRYSLRLGKNR